MLKMSSIIVKTDQHREYSIYCFNCRSQVKIKVMLGDVFVLGISFIEKSKNKTLLVLFGFLELGKQKKIGFFF